MTRIEQNKQIDLQIFKIDKFTDVVNEYSHNKTKKKLLPLIYNNNRSDAVVEFVFTFVYNWKYLSCATAERRGGGGI